MSNVVHFLHEKCYYFEKKLTRCVKECTCQLHRLCWAGVIKVVSTLEFNKKCIRWQKNVKASVLILLLKVQIASLLALLSISIQNCIMWFDFKQKSTLRKTYPPPCKKNVTNWTRNISTTTMPMSKRNHSVIYQNL